MLLERKHAIIYGAGGAIGGAVARAFAREGATVHLTGRTMPPVEALAESIRADGGKAETAQVDALDEAAVDEHAGAVAASGGSLDISFNLISHANAQGQQLVDMTLADFESPIHTRVRSNFITARAAARHMIEQGSGVILAFGGYGSPMSGLGGTQVGYGAIESLRRNLAIELGPHGIRVVTLQSGGVSEGIPEDVPEQRRTALTKWIEKRSMLKQGASLADVGNVAAFAASDHAAAMTATAFNITCGAEFD